MCEKTEHESNQSEQQDINPPGMGDLSQPLKNRSESMEGFSILNEGLDPSKSLPDEP